MTRDDPHPHLVPGRSPVSPFLVCKNAEAVETFAKIEGKRRPIARLWVASVEQSAAPAAMPAAVAADAAEPATGG